MVEVLEWQAWEVVAAGLRFKVPPALVLDAALRHFLSLPKRQQWELVVHNYPDRYWPPPRRFWGWLREALWRKIAWLYGWH